MSSADALELSLGILLRLLFSTTPTFFLELNIVRKSHTISISILHFQCQREEPLNILRAPLLN